MTPIIKWAAIGLLMAAVIWGEGTLAKEYIVAAPNWHVDFHANATIYTKAEWKAPKDVNDVGYYIIWVNDTYPSAIILYSFDHPFPLERTWMESYLRGGFSPFNKTPLMSSYTIDGKEGVVGEGWDDQFGRVVYGGFYPLDRTADNTASKGVLFLSLLDQKTSYEILNSLHVKYLGTEAMRTISNIQPAQPAPTYKAYAAGTREDPIPIGTSVDLGDGWQITVLNVIPDATNIVLKENRFNAAPKAGHRFFLARVRAKYMGSGSDTFGGGYRLRAVGPSSVGYSTFENRPGVIPDPLPDPEVFTSGTIEGYVGWEIKSSDASSLVMYDSPMSFGSNNQRVYMALFGQGISSTSVSPLMSDEEWAALGSGRMGRPYSDPILRRFV